MDRANRRFVRILVPWSVVTAGLLPGSCALQFRDALISATANFTAGTFVEILSSLIPVGT
ncbi:MAG: hypothetical protein HOP29_18020 [Phycisphaerales bacterium]|nr:hypothetical protein [Phycisphaerales bacterium]